MQASGHQVTRATAMDGHAYRFLDPWPIFVPDRRGRVSVYILRRMKTETRVG